MRSTSFAILLARRTISSFPLNVSRGRPAQAALTGSASGSDS